ncbi:trypsin-like peptidase domain-containing protein [Bizionia paragorgiae]|uniref:trypsin-like peptidase domain-containing protein n=1 Tax=Bizionia paragorgiae TaxID=283786 RepID=UPI00299D19D8|nr:trypsin-like peptidase domain-containing protein [Bizionia paragorgiae]MDX1270982.1 trypsin-like peptidase domain-containing protein [Bizionia paragorgiae]
MKKILTLVLVSVLGGAITLGAYKTFLEKDQSLTLQAEPQKPVFTPVNYTNQSSTLAAAEDIDFTSAAEKTVHAVVHVKNISLNTGQPTIEDLFMGRIPQRRQLGTGSGVIISPDGYIITNNHVIDGSEKLSITLNDNKTLDAEIIGTDPKTDIALLKVETDEELPYVTFGDSNQAKIGEWVLAVGNPFNLTSTVTAGIISAKSRDLTGKSQQSFIQTDAAVNPGNSGGALVNTHGELIGINTAISSQTGSYIGYSFAVPSNIARKVVEDIMEYGNVQNGILGVTGGTLNSMAAEKLGVDETEGFYVDAVEEDSGAEAAGLKQGDIIKNIDNVKISKFSDLRGYLDTKRPDDVVHITFLRNGKTKQTDVTLLKNNTFTIPNIGIIKEAKPKDLRPYKLKEGVKIVKLNSQYADYFRRDGVSEGNIITAINNTKVNSIEEVQTIIANRNPYQPLSIEIINSKGEKTRYGLR